MDVSPTDGVAVSFGACDEKKCDGAFGYKGTCKTKDSCPGDWSGGSSDNPICENREGVDFEQGDDVVCCHEGPPEKRRLDDKTEEQTALEAKVERLEAALADEKTANNANKAKAEALEASNAEIWAELRRLGAARA